MNLIRRNYNHLEAPAGPYVHTVKYNGLLFLSGLTAWNTPEQKLEPERQVSRILKNIEGILREEGGGFENLIKVTIFVTDYGDLEEFRNTLFRHYGDTLPASSLVLVNGLFHPDLKVEVEAIAAVS